MGDSEISSSTRVEQETLVLETTRRTIVKLMQTRRKVKTMNDTEDEIPNNDESFDPSGDAKQCIVQHEILHLSVDTTYGTGTEEDDRRGTIQGCGQ